MDINERGYLSEPDRFVFSTMVVRTEDAENGKTRVWLEKTYFYPFSGGQPDDRGTLDGLEVTQVSEDEYGICHTINGILNKGDFVEGRIESERRIDHTRQHSGQHLLSRLFLEMTGSSTVGFHLGEKTSTIDLDGSEISDAVLKQVEKRVNELIIEDIPLSSRILTFSEYSQLIEDQQGQPLKETLRSRLSDESDMVRIVEIKGVDNSTCCGTHVKSTGEIGLLKILGTEKIKAGNRVYFICGLRALADYVNKHDLIDSIARKFSTDWMEIGNAIDRLSTEHRSLRKEIAGLTRELSHFRAVEMKKPADRIGEYGIIRKVFDAIDPVALKELAAKIREENGLVILFGYRKPKPGLLFTSSAGIDVDLGEVLKASAEVMGARGGGGRDYAQGGGGDGEKVEEALEMAFKILKDRLV
ncbi:MAG: hypothetical protein JW814_09940 [Candidatus Krumholzibacteriota bacterium]|nr:hypothetical protein [Candidatus Krumholzibacteriota bacterium]